MTEQRPERSETEIQFDEVWSKRGTSSRSAEAVRLPGLKSGYGLPLFMALKETGLRLEKFTDGVERKKLYCIGLFEDRTLGSTTENLKPIGYIFLQEIVKDGKRQIVSSDNYGIGATSITVNQDGREVPDPLFSTLVETKYRSVGTKKVPLAAINVGFGTTYDEERHSVIDRLVKKGKVDQDILNEIMENKRGEASNTNQRLNEFQHTHLGLGRLLLDEAADVCRRNNIDGLIAKATNQNSRKLIAKSGRSYTEEPGRVFRNFIIDTKKV